MDIPYWNPILTKAWGLSIKGNMVFAVIYNSRGYAYLSTDAEILSDVYFQWLISSINSKLRPNKWYLLIQNQTEMEVMVP